MNEKIDRSILRSMKPTAGLPESFNYAGQRENISRRIEKRIFKLNSFYKRAILGVGLLAATASIALFLLVGPAFLSNHQEKMLLGGGIEIYTDIELFENMDVIENLDDGVDA